MDDADLQIFATWFHSDRELPGGGTPAERYAARTDLPADERAATARIAAARLGLHRVLAVEPGRWITVEDLIRGTRTRVRSPNASREAVRWDILLGRVIDGDPPSLWGPVRFFEPDDEPELLAELERLAGASGGQAEQAGMSITLRGLAALELMRCEPSSWSIEPSFFTLEGDPVAHGQASWLVRDPAAAGERLRALGGLGPDEPLEIDITASREALAANRPKLPPGAIVFEAAPVDAPDRVPIATLRLEGAELRAEATSEERLGGAIEIVTADFGDLVELADREVVAIEQRLDEQRSQEQRSQLTPAALDPAEEHRLVGEFMTLASANGLTNRIPDSTAKRRAKLRPASGAPRSSGWCAVSRTRPSARGAMATRPRSSHGCGANSALRTSWAQRTSSRLEPRRIATSWRYDVAIVATETATIRVTRETRDRLAQQARERGVSLSAMLAELALEAEREEAFRSEREAARADAGEPGVRVEEREWDAALGDGID